MIRTRMASATSKRCEKDLIPTETPEALAPQFMAAVWDTGRKGRKRVHQ